MWVCVILVIFEVVEYDENVFEVFIMVVRDGVLMVSLVMGFVMGKMVVLRRVFMGCIKSLFVWLNMIMNV